MGRIFAILMTIVTIALIADGTIPQTGSTTNDRSAQAAVNSFYAQVKNHNTNAAYAMISPSTNTSTDDFAHDVFGADGSLKTFSALQSADLRVLRDTGSEAMVRANLTWSTAIGAFHESRDLKVVKDGSDWKILYPVAKPPSLPPQVLAQNYLRWDIIHGGSGDDWGAQNVEAPHVRITSMSATERDGSTIIMGEVVNEDTVPAFVSVNATLLDQNNKEIGQESSFDKISHTLLPREVTPYRIDFPGVRQADVKAVNLVPAALLIPASADPVIGVMHQRIEKNNAGHTVLKGELINESGQIVNIPQVLATYYDTGGKVIWVSDGYVDHALQPQTPEPFSVDVRDDLAAHVHTFRVSINHYSINQ